MIRSLVRLTAALALASLLPSITHAATPAGLQYDEIVRVVVGSATPPPAGNFQADLAAVMSPPPVAATAAPRHHGFGNLAALAGAVVTGNAAGAVTDSAAQNVMDAQADRILAQAGGAFANAMRGLTQGRVERHSFYAGWERVDDVVEQTATITKCDLHQLIRLDLAKQTYSISDPSAVRSDTAEPAPKAHVRHERAAPEQPGTAVASFSNVVTPLAPKRIDGLDASGYDDTSTFAMSQATGSCRNGTFGFKSRAYYARFPAPRLVCPIESAPRPRYPQEPSNFVASGGCRPSFALHRTGPTPPAQNLALYQTIAVQGGAAGASPADAAGNPASSFVFLTERGNVHSLGPAQAGLFEIPAGFVKAP